MSFLPPPKPASDGLNFGLIQTRKLYGHLSSNGAGGVTVSSLISAEGQFDFVRILYLNASSNAYTVSNAAVAVTSAIGDGFTPSGGNSTFQNVTFNNAGAFGIPPSASGSTTSIVVPACSGAGATLQEGMVASDWMPLPSLERTDAVGSNVHLILIRTYASGTQYGLRGASQQTYNSWQQASENLGRPFRTFFKAGNCVSTPANFVSATESYIFGGTGLVAQFVSRVRGLSVIGVGDSLTQGHQYTSLASLTATIGGSVTTGDIISLTASNSAIPALPATASYAVLGTDTTTTIAAAIASAVNASNSMGAAGITASSSGAVITLSQPGAMSNATSWSKTVSGAQTETITYSNAGAMSGGAGAYVMSDYNSWGNIACATVSSAACPVSWANWGYGGETHATSYARAVSVANNLSPDILIFPCYSPNDGVHNQALVDAAWQRVVSLALLCQSKGIHFITTTPVPYSSSYLSDSYAQQFITRIKSAGFTYLDWYNILVDPNNLGNQLAAYNSGDGHPNLSGYAAMAGALSGLLQSFIGRRPAV